MICLLNFRGDTDKVFIPRAGSHETLQDEYDILKELEKNLTRTHPLGVSNFCLG